MKNDVLSEVWVVKETLAAEHEYNVRQLAEMLKKKEQFSNETFVDRSPRGVNSKPVGTP